MYDTVTRRYVSLEVIADLLREGNEVRVVDRATGDDITAVTLSQILVDANRQSSTPGTHDHHGEGREQLLGMVRASLSVPRGLGQLATGQIGRRAQAVEHRVGSGLRNLNIATVDDVRALEQRIDALSDRFDQLLRSLVGSTVDSPRERPSVRPRRGQGSPPRGRS